VPEAMGRIYEEADATVRDAAKLVVTLESSR
jgi:hypothetical protein